MRYLRRSDADRVTLFFHRTHGRQNLSTIFSMLYDTYY